MMSLELMLDTQGYHRDYSEPEEVYTKEAINGSAG